jgi:hypothetical protein
MTSERVDFRTGGKLIEEELAGLGLKTHPTSDGRLNFFLFEVGRGATGVFRVRTRGGSPHERLHDFDALLCLDELEQFEATLMGRPPRSLCDEHGVRPNLVCMSMYDPKVRNNAELLCAADADFVGDVAGYRRTGRALAEVVRWLVIPSWRQATTLRAIYSRVPQIYKGIFQRHAVALLMLGRNEEARAYLMERYLEDMVIEPVRTEELAIGDAIAARLGIRPWPPAAPVGPGRRAK